MPNKIIGHEIFNTYLNYDTVYDCRLRFFTNQIGKLQMSYSQNFYNTVSTNMDRGGGKGGRKEVFHICLLQKAGLAL
jgi:hypothetical protein